MSTTIEEMKIKQAATSDIAAVAARLKATVGDQEAEEYRYRRGREDGISWACDYAMADELRNLVENFESGRGDLDQSYDSPHWRGFIAGAEEVLDAAGPLLNATVDEQNAEEYQYRRGRRGGIAWAREYATVDELRELVENHRFRMARGDGIAWAREYATADELRNLVENFESGRGDLDHSYDSPHWRGFVGGAEEVLDAAGLLLNDSGPHDYGCFSKWLLEVAP